MVGLMTPVALALDTELMRARRKFPGNDVMLAALMEEVGELANALLELRFAAVCNEEISQRIEAVRKEAIQVACVAIRIHDEGDTSFPEYWP